MAFLRGGGDWSLFEWSITAAVLTAEVGGRGSRGEKNGGDQERGT